MEIYKTIYDIIAISCITFLFIEAEPIILFKRWIGFKEEEYDDYNKFKQFIYRLITCALCSGWWIGLAITFDPFQAAIISVISELLIKLNYKL